MRRSIEFDRVVFSVFLLLLSLGSPGLLLSQTGEEISDFDQDLFTEMIRVHVVNVEVYVTDRQGRPVTGLGIDDFELYENNQPMQITNFSAVEDGRILTRGETIQAAEQTPSAPPPAERPVIEEDERLRLVVYMDNFNIRPLERKRVMGQLRYFLRKTLGPEDRVLLASYDRSLQIRHPFTGDVKGVTEALRGLEKVNAEGSHYDSERRRILRLIDDLDSGQQALSVILPYADSVYHDLGLTIEAMSQMIDFLAGLPGRKAILHVSSGIPMVAAQDLFSAVEQKFSDTSAMSQLFTYDAARDFEKLGLRANANGVTFYMLDAGGLRPNAGGSAQEQGLDDGRISMRIDSDRTANLQNPLYFLADRTGGRAIVNQNEILPALEEVASDFRSFYSLGFTPGHPGDGRYYTIKVKVNRKGVQVRHREGYRDKPVETQMADGTRAALLHSFEINPLEVDLVIGRPQEREGRLFALPIQVRIPVGKLVLMPGGGHHIGRVRLYIAALDEQGGMSEVQDTPLGIKILDEHVEAARGEHWLYPHQLLMGPGRQRIALGVRDEIGSATSFIARSVTVGH